MSPYRILSMDGGGIRGLITAILLERLEQAHPGFLAEVDLFAGTSTGGLLALGLAAGKSPTEARQLYEVYGGHVFADSAWDNARDLGHLIGAQYDLDPLRTVLVELFGSMTLADLPKRVLISSFDLDNRCTEPGQYRTWKAKFFHNYPGPDSDGRYRVVDVGLYTAAAPTYFPVVAGFVDGGVVAGNPSMCALAQALQPAAGGQKLEDVALLSLGTGHNPKYLDVEDGDWGLAHWAPHIITLLMEGSTNLADYQCRQFLHHGYCRLDPRLPHEIAMDSIDEIPMLAEIARQYDLDHAISWLKRYF